MPFLDLGISILYVAAPEKTIDYFSFLAPLSTGVWLLMLAGGLTVSVAINIASRMSPFETAELDSAEGDSPFLVLGHCVWFSVASWVQQGRRVLPEMWIKCKSYRWLCIPAKYANLRILLNAELIQNRTHERDILQQNFHRM